MERMTKIDENIQTAQNILSGIIERCYELEKENKNLKEENKKFDKLKIRVYENLHKDMWKEYQRFCEENNI